MSRLSAIFTPYVDGSAPSLVKLRKEHPEKALVVDHIAADLCTRLSVLLDLGLGYLAMERSTPTLSPGELQRLRLATQVVRTCSASSMCWTNRRRVCIRPTPKRCCARSTNSKPPEIRSSWWSMISTSCAMATGSWMWGPPRANMAGKSSIAARRTASQTWRGRKRPNICSAQARHRSIRRVPAALAETARHKPKQSPKRRLRYSVGSSDDRHRRIWLRQKQSDCAGDRRTGQVMRSDQTRCNRKNRKPIPWNRKVPLQRRKDRRRHLSGIKALIQVDQKPIGRRHVRTSRPIPACSITSERFSRHAAGEAAALRCRAVLLQRRKGTVSRTATAKAL